MIEQWKPLEVENFEGRYEISNKGRLKRLAYSFWQRSAMGTGVYLGHRDTKILKGWKATKTCPLLNKVLHKTVINEFGELVAIYKKTVYQHRLVAQHFVPGETKYKDKVVHINSDKSRNWSIDLMWESQSFISKRSMVEHPENRDNLKKTNINSGYYKKLSRSRKRSGNSVPYFEFINNRVINNYQGRVARQNIISLHPLVTMFKSKLKDSKRFIFVGLEDKDIELINKMLPNYLTPKNRSA